MVFQIIRLKVKKLKEGKVDRERGICVIKIIVLFFFIKILNICFDKILGNIDKIENFKKLLKI